MKTAAIIGVIVAALALTRSRTSAAAPAGTGAPSSPSRRGGGESWGGGSGGFNPFMGGDIPGAFAIATGTPPGDVGLVPSIGAFGLVGDITPDLGQGGFFRVPLPRAFHSPLQP